MYWRSRHWTQISSGSDSDIKWLDECFVGEMHFEDDVPRFLKMVSEEEESLSSSSDRSTNKDKVHLSVDFGKTIDSHGTNFFIPNTIERLQNGYLGTALQARDGKTENEEPENSAFSLHPAPDVSPSHYTKAAQSLQGKARASERCQTLHRPSSTYSFDRGMTAVHFQIGDGLGPDGPSGTSNLPQLKGDGPNSPVGHFLDSDAHL
ncbi:hypothetical protein Ancab_006118 [Ancistrocladus abbreviatus]